ncbi:hypothetical protein LTSEMIN_0696, partial [Salmonella enterica subsp. enterica serovar Minnesota str. A4-603]
MGCKVGKGRQRAARRPVTELTQAARRPVTELTQNIFLSQIQREVTENQIGAPSTTFSSSMA